MATMTNFFANLISNDDDEEVIQYDNDKGHTTIN